MGRFPSAGRGGRAGSDPYRRPKYLSMPPPPPLIHTPPQSPTSSFYNSGDEEISFTTTSPFKELTLSFSSNKINDSNDNDWLTPKNGFSRSSKKHIDRVTSTSSPSTLQQLTSKYKKPPLLYGNSGNLPTNCLKAQIKTNSLHLPTWTIPLPQHLKLKQLLQSLLPENVHVVNLLAVPPLLQHPPKRCAALPASSHLLSPQRHQHPIMSTSLLLLCQKKLHQCAR